MIIGEIRGQEPGRPIPRGQVDRAGRRALAICRCAQARQPIEQLSVEAFAELIETAARNAPIAKPEMLARILARQAKRRRRIYRKSSPTPWQGLLDDYGWALSVAFVGPEGEEFFRSSLIQTAFYGLFAGWALWWQGDRKKPFRWEDLGDC